MRPSSHQPQGTQRSPFREETVVPQKYDWQGGDHAFKFSQLRPRHCPQPRGSRMDGNAVPAFWKACESGGGEIP